MINKITVFECDTCKRQIELEVKDSRPYPTRCAITYKCPGLYKKMGTKNSRSTLFPPIVYGVQDYIQRGTVITKVAPEEPNPLIPLLSGNRQLVLAATSKLIEFNGAVNDAWATEKTLRSDVDPKIFLYDPDTDNALLLDHPKHPMQDHIIWLELYELDVETTAFSEFYFLEKENASQVYGPDDSTNHEILRFSSADNIVITVNGVEIPRYNGSPQDRYFKIRADDNNIPENAIKFIPSFSESSNAVKIYVYKTPTFTNQSKIKTLVFKGLPDNDINRSISSWGDMSRVEINFQESPAGVVDRFLFTCVNFEVLPDTQPLSLNYRYIVKAIKAVRDNGSVVDLDPQDIHLLFGQPPFSFTDKVKDLTLSIDAAMNLSNGIILQYFQDESGNDALYVYKNDLAHLIDDINILEKVDDILLNNVAATQVNQADTLISSKYIIGYV
jgi:hypothetical protein